MANRDNPRKGSEFEKLARRFFHSRGLNLQRGFAVDVGIANLKRPHKFDLGCADPPVLVECKSHTWTKGGNSPSGKLSVWNEAMYYFVVAPAHFRKVLFVLRSIRKGESLGQHYVKRFRHLIPEGVEIWEFDPKEGHANGLYGV